MRSLRLLWVTPNLPRRGVTAAQGYWWALLSRLAQRHEITLVAFVDPEDAAPDDRLPPGLAAVECVPRRPYVPDDPLALLPRTVRGAFCDPALRSAVAARLGAGRFDLAQYEFVEMANLIPPSSVPTILTVHQIGFAQQGPLWRAQGRQLSQAPVALFRHLRDLDWELRAVQQAHQVITVSAEDAARLRRFLPDLRVAVSPVGVDCREFRPPAAPVPAEIDVLFVGHFGHPPNVDAARFLLDEITPRIGRPVRVRIVGRAIPPELEARARPGAIEIGPLSDLRPALAAAVVVAAPVRFGTGMRGKVLEALAMARPVVTTSVGAEGLGATPDRHLIVADDAEAFATGVRRVLDDPALAARVGAAGRALVEARFDWDTVAAAHDDIYAQALAAPPPIATPPLGRAPLFRRVLDRAGRRPALAGGAALLAARAFRWYVIGRHARARNVDGDRAHGNAAA